jgi:hypothetical protein
MRSVSSSRTRAVAVTASAHLGRAGEERDRRSKPPRPHLSVDGNVKRGCDNRVRNEILTSEVTARREH